MTEMKEYKVERIKVGSKVAPNLENQSSLSDSIDKEFIVVAYPTDFSIRLRGTTSDKTYFCKIDDIIISSKNEFS